MLESSIQSKILKDLAKKGVYCVRIVHASKRGKHDLLCCAPQKITQDMVGQTIGVFCSIEVKREDGEKSELQEYNRIKINKAGGRSGFARSVVEALKICFLK